MDFLKMDTTTLAYLGDAVYEELVREYIIQCGNQKANKLHAQAVKFVNASTQAKVIKEIFPDLPEEEQRLVKRARNKKTRTKAKNADPVEYKWSTAFEALIGYYKLSNKTNELEDIVIRALNIVEGNNVKK